MPKVALNSTLVVTGVSKNFEGNNIMILTSESETRQQNDTLEQTWHQLTSWTAFYTLLTNGSKKETL